MKKTYHMILFIVYVLFAIMLLHGVDKEARAVFDVLKTTYANVALSLGGAAILSLPGILSLLREKKKVVILKKELLFGCVCLFLSLSRLWFFTLFAGASLSLFTEVLADFRLFESMLAFCAGQYILKSLTNSVGGEA